jgi:hypothetical protein
MPCCVVLSDVHAYGKNVACTYVRPPGRNLEQTLCFCFQEAEGGFWLNV